MDILQKRKISPSEVSPGQRAEATGVSSGISPLPEMRLTARSSEIISL